MPSPKLPGSQKTLPRKCLQARMLFNYSKKSPPTLNPTFQRVLPITNIFSKIKFINARNNPFWFIIWSWKLYEWIRTFFFLTFKKYIVFIRLRSGPWKSWGHLPICQFSSPRFFQPVSLASWAVLPSCNRSWPISTSPPVGLPLPTCEPDTLGGEANFHTSFTQTALRATGTTVCFSWSEGSGVLSKTLRAQGGLASRGFGEGLPRTLQKMRLRSGNSCG